MVKYCIRLEISKTRVTVKRERQDGLSHAEYYDAQFIDEQEALRIARELKATSKGRISGFKIRPVEACARQYNATFD